jgi:GNAT superfamily N-acetyltransferase
MTFGQDVRANLVSIWERRGAGGVSFVLCDSPESLTQFIRFVEESGLRHPILDTVEHLQAAGHLYLLVSIGGNAVAACHLQVDGPFAFPWRLIVGGPHRRQGVASSIISALREDLKQAGCLVFQIACREDLRRYYEALGFHVIQGYEDCVSLEQYL